MVNYSEDRVMRPLHFAIIDEVDSILIDEARTPLIISGEAEKSTSLYTQANVFAKMLNRTKIINTMKNESRTFNRTRCG